MRTTYLSVQGPINVLAFLSWLQRTHLEQVVEVASLSHVECSKEVLEVVRGGREGKGRRRVWLGCKAWCAGQAS